MAPRTMTSNLRTHLLCSATLLGALLAAPSALAGTIYVDANLATGLGDGSTWANAFQGQDGLRAALATAVSGDKVFVADGLYRPSATGVRTESFSLMNGVEIYGGFLGGEATEFERPPIGSAPSILDGDLAGNDGSNIFTDNSYHLIRTTGTNATAVIDGFVVRSGNANLASGNNDRGGGILLIGGVSPTIRNCEFVANRCTFGGGAGYINGSTPRFTNCRFINNLGGSFGGAFDMNNAAARFDRCYFEGNSASRAGALEIFATGGAVVTNCIFTNNTATGSNSGGGIWVGSGTSALIRNCTLFANRSTGAATGGGLANSGASASIVNCIFWDNSGTGGAQSAATQISPGTPATYSIVEFGLAGTGNLSVDPQFVDVATRDFALLPTSPAIDAGNNAGVPAMIVGDFLAARRFFDEPSVADTGLGLAPIVDIGAHEYTTNIGAVFCSAVANSTGFSGRIDAEGSNLLIDNDVTLVASSLPANSNGYFLTSRAPGFVANPGGSSGNLCLGGAIGRYTGPGQIQNSGALGTFSLMIDLTNLASPTGGVAAQVGQTWYFQSWFRDSILGSATSNFTDGVALTLK
jgi:hypothetical protein